MKKSCVLITFVLVLAMASTVALAQEQINFADLPLVPTATPMPLGYQGMNWANFYYVNPGLYASSGPGYLNLLTHRDVVFVGGQFCGPVGPGCFGIISSPGGPTAFQVVSAVMVAGYDQNTVAVYAYDRGTYKGTINVVVSTNPQLVHFPASWGPITELQIQTNRPGNLVLWGLSLYRILG